MSKLMRLGILLVCGVSAFAQTTVINGAGATAPSGTGLAGVAGGAFTNTRVLTGSPAITVTNGDGAAGNPTVDLACNPGFPGCGRKGSVSVVSFFNSATVTNGFLGLGRAQPAACPTPNIYFPVAGYIRNVAMTTSNANGLVMMRGGANIDCSNTSNIPSGSTFIAPGSAAGAYVDSSAANFYHVGQGGLPNLVWVKPSGNSGTSAAVLVMAAEFIDDAGLYASILGASPGGSLTSSTTQYGTLVQGGTIGTTELVQAIPVPFAATVSNFTLCTAAAPAANLSPVVRKNGAGTTVTVTVASADPASACYADLTHSFSVAAGDYINVQYVSGASTVATIASTYLTVAPASGTSTMLAGLINATISTTPNFIIPGTATAGTSTLANEQLGMPIACTASNLYVVQAVANGSTVTTTFTLEKNGVDTAITGTVNQASGTGSIALDITHTASYARGDLMSLKYVTGSGTSGSIGGWAIQCQ